MEMETKAELRRKIKVQQIQISLMEYYVPHRQIKKIKEQAEKAEMPLNDKHLSHVKSQIKRGEK